VLTRWPVNLVRGLSLADKCLVLFGGAVVLIVAGALVFPWLRMQALVDEGELDFSRYLADSWADAQDDQLGNPFGDADQSEIRNLPTRPPGLTARLLSPDIVREQAGASPRLAKDLARFVADPSLEDSQAVIRTASGRSYRYLRPQWEGQTLTGLLVLERPSPNAGRLVVINTLYLLSAGSFVLGLAILVFYLITHKLVLAPVRELTRTAERVRSGEVGIRSEIETGDEFEVLAETFNQMLESLSSATDKLRSSNAAMDLKLTELAEANIRLYESMQLKSDFLASVSHELRTPLNAIIGFAELLMSIADRDTRLQQPPDEASLAKRQRYLNNIVSAGRSLLEMIEDLLEMAKIEAGRVNIEPEAVNLNEVCDGLMGLVYPLAERKGITARLVLGERLPVIYSDPRKLQQILFNFLANAVKFTGTIGSDGRPGEVVLRAERLPVADRDGIERVRISVMDNGPGISPEDHESVFEKFRQLDSSHTRGHAGTGLGLAIAKEFAMLIQAEIHLQSDIGEGAMFTLVVPVKLDESRLAEQVLEHRFRATLVGRTDMDEPDPPATFEPPTPEPRAADLRDRPSSE
jgi:two-component system, NarL family, sensor histidine kinase BarA